MKTLGIVERVALAWQHGFVKNMKTLKKRV
jgi:hypothetical protein